MQRIFFHTFGCKVNQYETETLRARLARCGYEPVRRPEESDLCVINSCSVTAEADRKCRQFVRRVLRANARARVLVTGCYATRAPRELHALSQRVEVYANQEKDLIPEALSGCSLGADESGLLTRFQGRTRAFVKVQDGCDASCTYCIIPKVRPRMLSRPLQEVLSEVEGLVREGYKEIVLTGIRLGSYGLAAGAGRAGRVCGNLAELLGRVSALPGEFRVRLSSLEITEVTDELLVLVAGSARICRHFHLPLQSGDDLILRRMGRWYTGAEFSARIGAIRRALPDAGITSDVIVGFPGETEERFRATYDFVAAHLNGLHVFPFSVRAGTPAARLSPPCPAPVRRERVRRLLDLDARLRRDFAARFAGRERQVLAERDGGFSDNGIRVPAPLPFPEGTLAPLRIPPLGAGRSPAAARQKNA